MWSTFLFSATAGMFFVWTLFVLRHLRWVLRLPSLESLTRAGRSRQGGGWPGELPARCSVVIAARNEEARIEQSIRHLLAQRAVDLELIVVDDRSTDRTGEILARLSKEDARLQVRRVDVLPERWLGKCHACHIGAGAATGDWILFTDADCWLRPDVIARALKAAEHEGADHVAIASGIAGGSSSLRAAHLMFLISLANWLSGVNRDRPKSYVGFGAFNLVRAAVYRKCGGYEALRLTVLDDVRLGLLMRRSGGKTRGYLGGDDVECHWGKTALGMIQLMEKNYFAALDYRVGMVVGGTLFVVLVMAILVLGVVSGTTAGLAAALSPFALALPGAILARRLDWPPFTAAAVPFMVPLFFYALNYSAFVTLRRGGVRWRDTFYPLATLRAGNVR